MNRTAEHEPMVRLNGWSIKLANIVQIAVIVLGGVGAWYTLTGQVERGIEKIEDLSALVAEHRKERISAIEKLTDALNGVQIEAARTGGKVENLELLLGDLRKRFDEIDKQTLNTR